MKSSPKTCQSWSKKQDHQAKAWETAEGWTGSQSSWGHHRAAPLSPWVRGIGRNPQPWALGGGYSEHTERNRELPTPSGGSGCWFPATVCSSRTVHEASICFLIQNGPESHTLLLGTTQKQRESGFGRKLLHPRPWGHHELFLEVTEQVYLKINKYARKQSTKRQNQQKWQGTDSPTVFRWQTQQLWTTEQPP